MDVFEQPLFVMEMANNHMGDVAHGLRIIQELRDVCASYPFRFAVKLQYRHLDSLVHPDFVNRSDIRYLKRFAETRLSPEDYRRLVAEIKACGFLAMCTPFDEASVDAMVQDGLEILKIASCSCTDWPLLERAVRSDLPMILSTAGVASDDLDNVVTFLRNRCKAFALMHCVAEYPTPPERLELNQIDMLARRYSGVPIGYSTHEDPALTAPVGLAIAKHCKVFEKHVGIATEQYPLNNYSATPAQIDRWLQAAREALTCCGTRMERGEPTPAEASTLFSLRRGAFARTVLAAGQTITNADVFFAMPTQSGHVTANDWSKYNQYVATSDIAPGEPILRACTRQIDTRGKIQGIVATVKDLLHKANLVVPRDAPLEISHHYGIESADKFGASMITVVNREYCKKLIVMLPGQRHPAQYHKLKEETFHVLYGSLSLDLDGVVQTAGPGTVATVGRGVHHAFGSAEGAVFEEISSTHHADDSFYLDPAITSGPARKTFLKYWLD